MQFVKIALVSNTDLVSLPEMVRVTHALTIQLNRDAGPVWGVSGSVVALPDDQHLDAGTWPIYIEETVAPGIAGNHATEHNQPLAVIEAGPSWSLNASHEMLEMAVDPYGNRLVAAPAIGIGAGGAIADMPGKVEYLVEVCDPSEDPTNAYLIDDVLVADFITPAFFDPAATTGARYSFKGAITRPREVLPNGYLTWFEPQTRKMRQLRYLQTPAIVDLADGAPVTADLLRGRSLRSFVDSQTARPYRLSDLALDHPAMALREAARQSLAEPRAHRAGLFRAALQQARAGHAHAATQGKTAP